VWVDLSALTTGSQIAGAVARAAGLQPSPDDVVAQLRAAWQHRASPEAPNGVPLLVLDNAEHLVADCADLLQRLAVVPGLVWLVTSQLALGLADEEVHWLRPLPMEGDEGALSLLLHFIRRSGARFELTPQRRSLLLAIAEHLDGLPLPLPLALEMAAARVPLLGVQAVHDGLAQRFALLKSRQRGAAPRHQTLLSALRWSYQLLDEREQCLLHWLSLFTGSFTLEAAVSLAAGDDEPSTEPPSEALRWNLIDDLGSLVDRSLVAVGRDDPPRYRLLESVRLFAAQGWTEPTAPAGLPPMAQARGHHARLMLARFSQHFAQLAMDNSSYLSDMDDAREAVAWAREHALGTALPLAALALRVAVFSPWRREAADWLEQLEPLLDSPAGQALPGAIQAAGWVDLGYAHAVHHSQRGAELARRGYEAWKPLGQALQTLAAAGRWVAAQQVPGPDLVQALHALQAQLDANPDLPASDRPGDTWRAGLGRFGARRLRTGLARTGGGARAGT
jgi:non-specific serine/threonine protein kinase